MVKCPPSLYVQSYYMLSSSFGLYTPPTCEKVLNFQMYTLTPEKFFVKLKRDPSLQLGCSIVAHSDKSYRDNTLIICVSGVDNLQTIWYPMVEAIRKDKPKYLPPILMYDRVGQGASTRKDTRLRGLPAGFQGDCLDAAHDIHDIVEHVATTRFGLLSGSLADLRIIFVGNSIGCAISRLYAQTYPRTVAGLLLLDSTIANSDTVSLFPDPMSPGFDASKLPPGATAEVCTRARKIVHQIYHPTSKNREGLWRGNLPELLPYADGPKLQGPAPGTPFVTVVEHDHSLFAQEVEKVDNPSPVY